jgi:hypothetical protein
MRDANHDSTRKSAAFRPENAKIIAYRRIRHYIATARPQWTNPRKENQYKHGSRSDDQVAAHQSSRGGGGGSAQDRGSSARGARRSRLQEAKKGFTLPGLGKLVLVNRKARTGRNPATGEAIKIPAKKVLKFRIAKAAKDAILGAKK